MECRSQAKKLINRARSPNLRVLQTESHADLFVRTKAKAPRTQGSRPAFLGSHYGSMVP